MKRVQQLKLVLIFFMLAASIQLWAQTPQQIAFTWESSGAKKFIFNAERDKDITVNWGDGTSNVYKGKGIVLGKKQEIECNHTYDLSGTYHVSVKPTDGNIGMLSIQTQNTLSLNVSGCDNLKYLYVGNNQLSSLDVSKNTKLVYLECYNNQLSDLDVSKSQALKILGCYSNQLTNLNVSDNPNLAYLLCQNNQLPNLNLASCKALMQLTCYGNQLTGLDLKNCTSLTSLKCNANKLTSLDISRNIVLSHLECHNNYLLLSDLYRYSNPNLQYNLKSPHVLPTQTIHVNAVVDLSKEALFDEVATTFKVLKKQGPEIAIDYTLSQGKLVFKTPGAYSVEMTNTAIVSNNLTACYVRMSYLVTEPPVAIPEQITFSWEASVGVKKDITLSVDLFGKPLIIDWGDGTSDAYNGSRLTPTHMYNKSGTYQLSVKCTELDGKITGLDVGQRDVISLDVSNAPSLNMLTCHQNRITNLDVSKHTRLWLISCSNNLLTTLNVSGTTNLNRLICDNNEISVLDLSSSTHLEYLSCNYNYLTTLDLSKNGNLGLIFCNNNLLTHLNISRDSRNTNLVVLDCRSNQLTSLATVNNHNLMGLNCEDNLLTDLDVSHSVKLSSLACDNNQLTNLDISKNINLGQIFCNNNQLTQLDISKNIDLMEVFCENNQLTQLDVSKNKDLTEIYCAYNALTVLDVRNNLQLSGLYCRYNQLTHLDLREHSKLTELDCGYNSIAVLDVNMNANFKVFDCENNQISLSKLYPFSKQSNKTRAIGFQQLPNTTLSVNAEIDLSGESVFDGVATDFNLKKGNTTAVINTDYTLTGGKLRFIRPGQYRIEMSNSVIRSKVIDIDGDIATVSFYVTIIGTKSALLADHQAYTGPETVTVYPNPTSGLVYIKSNREEQPKVKVYNATGNLLLQVQQAEVDLSGYPDGLYLFRVGSQTVKVIKH